MDSCNDQNRETLEILLFEVLKGLEKIREANPSPYYGPADTSDLKHYCTDITHILNDMQREIHELKSLILQMVEDNSRLEKRISLLYYACRKLLTNTDTSGHG
ncbi:MAG: hypothetical protein LRS47_02820 [Desulfurococcales archaeon]|nr:hypothetical protein [Desulfurococcales archaeon]